MSLTDNLVVVAKLAFRPGVTNSATKSTGSAAKTLPSAIREVLSGKCLLASRQILSDIIPVVTVVYKNLSFERKENAKNLSFKGKIFVTQCFIMYYRDVFCSIPPGLGS